MIALGTSRSSTPTALDTTTIIGASATIGMVWLITAQGITDMSTARLCTMATASATP